MSARHVGPPSPPPPKKNQTKEWQCSSISQKLQQTGPPFLPYFLNERSRLVFVQAADMLHISASEGTLSITQTAGFAVFSLPPVVRVNWLAACCPCVLIHTLSHAHTHTQGYPLSFLMQCFPLAFLCLHSKTVLQLLTDNQVLPGSSSQLLCGIWQHACSHTSNLFSSTHTQAIMSGC